MTTVLAAAVLLGGCAGRDSAGPEVGVTVEDVQEPQPFFEGEYLGRVVTVSAEVTGVLGPRSIELAAREYGEDSLLVQAPQPIEARPGQVVRVTGTVGQYHVFLESEGVPPVQGDMFEEYETEAYLYDAAVEPLPG